MIIFYFTIPLMLVAVGLAVTPLLWAIKRQFESEAPISATSEDQRSSFRCETGTGQVTNAAHPSTDVSGRAA